MNGGSLRIFTFIEREKTVVLGKPQQNNPWVCYRIITMNEIQKKKVSNKRK